MATVMKWDGLNLPQQNFTNSLKGPGDLSTTSFSNDHTVMYKYVDADGDGKFSWHIDSAGAGSRKRTALSWGSLGSRGAGNLNNGSFHVGFYFRANTVPDSGRRFRFFRAYDLDGRWLATLVLEGNNLHLTDDTGVSRNVYTNFNSLNGIKKWNRFDISFNKVLSHIGVRINDGSWQTFPMNTTMKSRKRLNSIAIGCYEYQGPSWQHVRNVIVTDDDKPIPPYSPPAAPKVSMVGGTTAKTEVGNTVNLTATITQGAAAISTRRWDFISGPVTPTIDNRNTDTATISGLSATGNYAFKYSVKDANNYEVSANKVIAAGAVSTAPNFSVIGETVFQGQSAYLTATNVDPGTNATGVISYRWEFVAGPVAVEIDTPQEQGMTTSPLPYLGEYIFSLTATNSLGLSSTVETTVTVTAAVPPTAQILSPTAGDNFILSGDELVVEGSSTAGSLPIASTQWMVTPNTAEIYTFTTPDWQKVTRIKFTEAGVYSLVYRVTDVGGNSVDSEHRMINVLHAVPPTIVAPSDQLVDINEYSAVDLAVTIVPGDRAISSYFWEVASSPENVGAVVETNGATSTRISGFTNLGAYTIRLTVTDTAGIETFEDIVLYIHDSARPVGPDIPVDPLDLMSNAQLFYKVVQYLSGTPDGNTTQILKRYYQSVVTNEEKYHMSFHQVQKEFYKEILNGKINVTLALFGILEGGNAEDGTG